MKYKNCIDAFEKIDCYKSLEEQNISLVKAGVNVYEVGKGNPKMTKEDVDNHIYEADSMIDDSYKPYYLGKDVNRYYLSWNNRYLKYGPNLAAMRDPNIFVGPRLLIRQIPTRSTHALFATYTDKSFISDRTSILLIDIKKIDPLYLLGILNSKCLTLWIVIKLDKFQRKTFPRLVNTDVKKFPIPIASKNIEMKISNLVKSVLIKAAKNEVYANEDSQIDELVMDAYGLTEKEKQEVRDFNF